MRHQVARLALTFASVSGAGCSLIYNPSNIPTGVGDAAPDQMVDADIDAPLADANPAKLEIDSFFPATINEGQGDLGSRPMMLVLIGHQMIADAQVTLASTPPGMVTADNSKIQIAADGNSIAVPVTALVDDTLTGDVELTVTVTQLAGTVSQTAKTTLKLTKLGTLKTVVVSGGVADASQLAKLYAKVDLGATPIAWIGDSAHPVIIKAVSSITVPAMTANGGGGGKNAAGGGGPGGCAGGGAGGVGGCGGDAGGGGQASGTGGGGGGGHAVAGTAGAGMNGGPAGGKQGASTIVDYTLDHGTGGGGGAAGTLSQSGGGGGGGGTIELTAGGTITAGALQVKGGGGGGAGSLLGGSGGGGGGAGGTVVIRSAAGALTLGAITIDGGGGGAGASGGGAGGPGAVGRVRADTPSSGVPTGAHQNPTFATSNMQIVVAEMPTLTVVGTTQDAFDVYVVDSGGNIRTDEPQNQTIGANGMKTFVPTLNPGYNLVCATIKGGTQGGDLSDICMEVAFLP